MKLSSDALAEAIPAHALDFTPALVSLLCAGLVGCGGGSSGQDAINDGQAIADTTPPVITLNGASPMEIEEGEPYVEPGATAEDDVDGTVEVTIEGSVGAAPGEYVLTYSASDSAGNLSSVERIVIVMAASEEGILGKSPEEILETLSLTQKAAQLIQAEISHISLEDIRQYGIGSVLNGGGSYPDGDRAATVEEWRQYSALLRKPHWIRHRVAPGYRSFGEQMRYMGTITFEAQSCIRTTSAWEPQMIRGSCAPSVRQQLTPSQQRESTGYSPTVAQARDFRWGRTYESYSNNSELVSDFAFSIIDGIQSRGLAATAKHFIGDGGTERGIDQGNTPLSDAELLTQHGSGYEGAIAADVLSIMATFNSVRGEKVHGNEPILKDMLSNNSSSRACWSATGMALRRFRVVTLQVALRHLMPVST